MGSAEQKVESSDFIQWALRFSRRGFLGRAGATAAVLVGSTLLPLGVNAPPVFAQGSCSLCTGPCSSCASGVPACYPPDYTCTCTASCYCPTWESGQACNPPSVYAYTLCCTNCAPPTTSGCGSC
ncbi:MAG: twin-arginine translocation signal domain-containing protein [Chloroflexota bacterium]|nr:twin-arginine translocation signal domain-containing protein [Chloroflexota bacterium]